MSDKKDKFKHLCGLDWDLTVIRNSRKIFYFYNFRVSNTFRLITSLEAWEKVNSENSEKGGVTFSDFGFHEFYHQFFSLRRRIKILTRSRTIGNFRTNIELNTIC